MLQKYFCTYAFCVAFIAGATVVQFCPSIEAIQISVLIVGFSVLSFYSKKFYLIPVLGFCLGFSWVAYNAMAQIRDSFPHELEKQSVLVKGKILGLPKYADNNISFDFKVEELWFEKKLRLQNIKTRLSCYHCPLNVKPAEEWQFLVKLKKPHGFASWGSFDYEKYLFRHHIIARGYIRARDENNRRINALNSGFNFQYIHVVRYLISEYISDLIKSNPDSVATINALMVGNKSLMSVDQYEVLQKTGLSHLFAISGLHIGLVFLLIRALCRYLSAPFSSIFIYFPKVHLQNIFGLIFAFVYALMAGFSIPTQRASIMLSIYVLLQLFGLYAGLVQLLLISALLIILFDAFAVMDVGFWLSFGAVLIIGMCLRNIRPISLLELQPRLWFGMLPFMVLFFQSASFIAPFLNLLVIPIFTFLLIPGLLICLFCLVTGFSQFADMLLINIVPLLEEGWQFLYLIAQSPISQRHFKEYSFVNFILLVITVGLYIQPHKIPSRYLLIFLSIATLITPGKSPKDDMGFSVTMLDVGQGLSMVVQTRNHSLVYDTGAKFSESFNAADAVLIPYLRQQGVDQLDMVIISHADNDHIGGYQALNNQYRPTKLVSSRPDTLSNAEECMSGQKWYFDNIAFEILGPDVNSPKGSNNRSCVLKVSSSYGSILITGDIERSTEKYLLQNNREKLRSQLMLIPHQGSRTSSSVSFIDAVKPQIAIVSAGYLNQYGHPDKTVIDRYQERKIQVFNNIESGSIRVEFSKQGMLIEEYRKLNRHFW